MDNFVRRDRRRAGARAFRASRRHGVRLWRRTGALGGGGSGTHLRLLHRWQQRVGGPDDDRRAARRAAAGGAAGRCPPSRLQRGRLPPLPGRDAGADPRAAARLHPHYPAIQAGDRCLLRSRGLLLRGLVHPASRSSRLRRGGTGGGLPLRAGPAHLPRTARRGVGAAQRGGGLPRQHEQAELLDRHQYCRGEEDRGDADARQPGRRRRARRDDAPPPRRGRGPEARPRLRRGVPRHQYGPEQALQAVGRPHPLRPPLPRTAGEG